MELSIRISAFFSSSPQICRVRHLQQWISSKSYSCMVIKHRLGRQQQIWFTWQDTNPLWPGLPVHKPKVPLAGAGVLALTAQRAGQTFLWWFQLTCPCSVPGTSHWGSLDTAPLGTAT